MSYTSSSTNSGNKSHARIRQHARGAFRAASAQLDEVRKDVKGQVKSFSNELAKNVKKSPIKSVLIAAAIGVVFGKLFL